MKFKLRFSFTPLLLITLFISCNWRNKVETADFSEVEKWKLGWRLINSSLDKNYPLGEQQFDSLIKMDGRIETKFLVTGLDILAELGKKEKIIVILSKQDRLILDEICNKELFTEKLTDIQICKSIVRDEIVGDKTLQIELIKMYVNDQSVRGNILNEIISRYKLGEYELTKLDAVSIDKMNRERLKEEANKLWELRSVSASDNQFFFFFY